MAPSTPVVFVVSQSSGGYELFRSIATKAIKDLRVIWLREEKSLLGIKPTTVYVLPGSKIPYSCQPRIRIGRHKVFQFNETQWSKFIAEEKGGDLVDA